MKFETEIKANIDAIEDALKCVQQLEAELQEIYDLQKRIMNEECAPDEKHCTCVPLLRHKCKQLEAENKRMRNWLKQTQTSTGYQGLDFETLAEIKQFLESEE